MEGAIEIHPPHFEGVIFALGWVQLALNATVAIANACFNAPLLWLQNDRHFAYEINQAAASGKASLTYLQQLFTKRIFKDYWATFSTPLLVIAAVQLCRAAVIYQKRFTLASSSLRVIGVVDLRVAHPLFDATRNVCRRRSAHSLGRPASTQTSTTCYSTDA